MRTFASLRNPVLRLVHHHPIKTLLVSIVILGLVYTTILSIDESTQWGMGKDLHYMMYIGYLTAAKGRFPHRDIFDNNLPGSHIFYQTLGKIVGFDNDFALRCADLALLLFIAISTVIAMRRQGVIAGCVAACTFCLCYLSGNINFSLQRDYIAVPLWSLSLMLFSFERINRKWKILGLGLLASLSGSIKPMLSLGPLTLLLRMCLERRARHSSLTFIVAFAGLMAPALLISLYLWRHSALAGFIWAIKNYFPLYGRLASNFELASFGLTIKKVIEFEGLKFLLPPAVLGGFILIRTRRVSPYILMTFAGIASLILQRKFWAYHWIPLLYSTSLLVGISISPYLSRKTFFYRTAILIICLGLQFHMRYDSVLHLPTHFKRPPLLSSYVGFCDHEVAPMRLILETYLSPGEKAQTLDTVAGANLAMLRAGIELSTQYVADIVFYQEPTLDVVAAMRRRFSEELRASSPKVILESLYVRPYVNSAYTTLPEVLEFLRTHYVMIYDGSFRAYVGKDAVVPTIFIYDLPATSDDGACWLSKGNKWLSHSGVVLSLPSPQHATRATLSVFSNEDVIIGMLYGKDVLYEQLVPINKSPSSEPRFSKHVINIPDEVAARGFSGVRIRGSKGLGATLSRFSLE